jgi:AcrR family transcriptional regulator
VNQRATKGTQLTGATLGKRDPRSRVIEITRDLVFTQPLTTVSIRQIADASGMSPSHVLYYFGTKDELLFETWMWHEESLARARRLAYTRMASAAERLRHFVECAAPSPHDPHWLLWFYILARQTGDQRVEGRVAQIQAMWLRDLTDAIEYGVEIEEFNHPDPEAFSIRLQAYIDGLALNVVNEASWITRQTMIEWALDFATEGLGYLMRPREA